MGMLLTLAPRRKKTLLLMVVGLLLVIPACGGGSSSGGTHDPGTPIGSYTVSVTATSGSISHSTSFNLTVQ